MNEHPENGFKPIRYRWVVMTVFNIAHATAVVGALVLGVLLPSISNDLGLTPSEQGWLGASTLIGSLVLSLPFGWWLSRCSPKILTSVTLVMGCLCVFVQGLAPNFLILILGRLLFGISPVAREPARMLLVRQWLPQREIQLSSGILNAVFGLSLTGSFVITPILLEAFDDNWRHTMYAWGCFNAAMALLWIIFGRENPTGDYQKQVAAQEVSPIRSIFKYKEPWLLGIGMVGYSLAQMAQFTFWPTFMQEKFDMSLVSSGVIIGVVGVVVALGGFVMLPILSRTGSYGIPLIVIGVLVSLTSIAVLYTDSIPMLVTIFIINGLARGAFWVPFTSIPFELPGILPRETAVVQGVMFSMLWAGGIIGPVLVGSIQEITDNLELAMVVTSCSPILVTVIGFFLLAPRLAVAVSTEDSV